MTWVTSRILPKIFFIVGLLAVIWVAGSLSGLARSQTGLPGLAPAAPAADAPTALPMDKVSEQTPADASALVMDKTLEAELAAVPANTDGFTYDPTGKRDPFSPYQMMVPSAASGLPATLSGAGIPGKLEPSAAETDPLRAHDLSQYKVVGIMWDVQNPRAVIQAPGGKSITIKKQTHLGRNNGFVSQIREGEIVVVEPTIENGLPVATARILELNR